MGGTIAYFVSWLHDNQFLSMERSRVDQKGWEDVCGETLRQIHQEPIELNDLKFNLDDIRMKTREILKV